MRLMRTPKTLDIQITSRCNLRCRYCSYYESAGEVAGDLPLGEWERFFEEAGRCAVMDVCLQGGEPFIREDLQGIVKAIVRNRMRFSILTNGTLITDGMAAFLASTGRCSFVQVSIDGSIPVTHDSMRGKGTFRRAVEGIRTLQRHRVTATVRVTVHRKNVHDLEGVARLLFEEIGLSAISTNSASHMGLCQKNAEMVQLTARDRVVAMESLLRLASKYEGRISAAAGPLAEGKTWLEMEKARIDGLAALPGRGFLTGCNGPSRTIAIRSDGVMVPCSTLGHMELGRINRESLAETWKGHPHLTAIRERHRIPLGAFSFCAGCAYIPYCTGSCPGLAYTTTGEVDHPAPDACLRQFLAQGGRLPDASLLSGKPGEGPPGGVPRAIGDVPPVREVAAG